MEKKKLTGLIWDSAMYRQMRDMSPIIKMEHGTRVF